MKEISNPIQRQIPLEVIAVRMNPTEVPLGVVTTMRQRFHMIEMNRFEQWLPTQIAIARFGRIGFDLSPCFMAVPVLSVSNPAEGFCTFVAAISVMRMVRDETRPAYLAEPNIEQSSPGTFARLDAISRAIAGSPFTLEEHSAGDTHALIHT